VGEKRVGSATPSTVEIRATMNLSAAECERRASKIPLHVRK